MLDLNKKYRCPACDNTISVDLKDFIVDEITENTRLRGAETEYIIDCGDYECPHCNIPLTITGSISEYPDHTENINTMEIKKR